MNDEQQTVRKEPGDLLSRTAILWPVVPKASQGGVHCVVCSILLYDNYQQQRDVTNILQDEFVHEVYNGECFYDEQHVLELVETWDEDVQGPFQCRVCQQALVIYK